MLSSYTYHVDVDAQDAGVPLNEELIIRNGSRVILLHDLHGLERRMPQWESAKWQESLEEVQDFIATQFNARKSKAPNHRNYGVYAALVLTESESDFRVGHLSLHQLQEEIERFWGFLEPMGGPIYESWLSYFIRENHTFGLVHAWIAVYLDTSIVVSDEELQGRLRDEGPRHINPEYPPGHSAEIDGVPAPAFTRPIIQNSDGCKVINLKVRIQSRVPDLRQTRRVFDVCANRVIPSTWFPYQVNVEPVSHAWVALQDREYIMTEINQKLWPVPVPRGVQIEAIRQELIKLNVRYAWLDVFCLRQHSPPVQHSIPAQPSWYRATVLSAEVVAARESRRLTEWEVDVPTIGPLYSRSGGRVVLWLSGLGRKFRDEGWNDQHHWLQRVWTIQETRSCESDWGEDDILVAGLGESFNRSDFYASGHDFDRLKWRVPGLCQVDESGTSLYQAMERAAPYKPGKGRLIAQIIQEIQRRHSTIPVDRVASLSSILTHSNQTVIPTYDASEAPEEAWERLVTTLGDLLMVCTRLCCQERSNTPLLQLLHLFPNPSAQHWFPSWAQVMAYPDITLREPQLLDGISPEKDRALKVFSGRLYRLCELQVAGVEDNITLVKVTAKAPAGDLCSVRMTSRLPRSQLEEILMADAPLVLLDITPVCVRNSTVTPLWPTHLVLVCRELSPFKLPEPIPPLRTFNFRLPRPPPPPVYQYRLRRVTTLEWPEPISTRTVRTFSERESGQNWLPFQFDLGSKAMGLIQMRHRTKGYHPNGFGNEHSLWDVPVGFEVYLQ